MALSAPVLSSGPALSHRLGHCALSLVLAHPGFGSIPCTIPYSFCGGSMFFQSPNSLAMRWLGAYWKSLGVFELLEEPSVKIRKTSQQLDRAVSKPGRRVACAGWARALSSLGLTFLEARSDRDTHTRSPLYLVHSQNTVPGLTETPAWIRPVGVKSSVSVPGCLVKSPQRPWVSAGFLWQGMTSGSSTRCSC